MKHGILTFVCLSAMLTFAATAQPASNEAWIGVWQGQLDGKPGVMMTLAEDDGGLGGTVVFNVVVRRNGGEAHVAGSEPRMLLHPHLDGNTLAFGIIRASDARKLEFSVKMGADDKAYMKCLNCGPDAPLAELDKIHWQ